MICIDLDGTLLGKKKYISDETKKVLQQASNLNKRIVITTGRLYNNAAQILEGIGIKEAIIAENGAVIRDDTNNIFMAGLDLITCEKINKLMRKYKIIGHYYTVDTVIPNCISGMIMAFIYKSRNKSKSYNIKVEKCFSTKTLSKVLLDNSKEILKCVTYSKNEENIKKFKNELKQIKNIEVYGAGKYSLEINAKGVSKGNAVRILSEYYNIKREEIICIGDNENDLSMIEYAGLGIAMGNAIDELKEIANHITKTNLEDGVAEAIKKFVL